MPGFGMLKQCLVAESDTEFLAGQQPISIEMVDRVCLLV